MRSDRRRLAFTLADDPKAAAQSVPALLELLKDTGWPQYMSKCIHGFRGTGDDVDVYASYVWSASSPDLVAYCPLRPDLIALVRAGPSIIPQLTPALADPVLRPHVLYVLGEIGPSAATAVPSIVPILADADPVIREQAACTLGLIGPAAQAAIPQLQAILGDPNPRVRYNALRAIHSIERSDRPLQVPDDPALKLIEEVGGVGKLPATAEELAAVIMPISDPYSEYHHSCHARAAACDALAALGQQAIPAIPALEFARWYDPSYIVRKTAARALQTLTIPTTHP